MNLLNLRHLIIETCAGCNRQCASCFRQTYPQTTEAHHKLRFPVTTAVGSGSIMPMATIERILTQAVDMGFTGRVQLQYYNEPLLDDRLPEICQLVKKFPQIVGCDGYPATYFFSNLDLMTPSLAKKLDGVVGLIFGTLYMDPVAANKRSLKIYKMFRHTHIVFREGNHYTSHYSPFYDLKSNIRSVIDEPCTQFNDMMIVRFDGEVMHCCEDYGGEFNLGNVNDRSVPDIWNSRRHQDIVGALSKAGGRRAFKHCRSCPRNNQNCESMKPVYEVKNGN